MTGVNDFDLPRHAFDLVQFMGHKEVDRLIKFSKKANFNGSLEREFFLNTLHPWALGFRDLKGAVRKGPITTKDINPDIRRVGTDAVMFLPILRSTEMPKKVLKDFKRRLCDPSSGRDAIFELTVAQRFFNLGKICWIDDPDRPGAEFDTYVDGHQMRVECKTLGADTGKKFARQDFYRLADRLSKKVLRMRLKGEIHVQLSERLPSNQNKQQAAVDAVMKLLKKEELSGNVDLPWCTIRIKLTSLSGIAVGQSNLLAFAKSVIPEGASAATFCRTADGADPLVISISTEQPNQIIKAMLGKISETKRQIGEDSYGAVYVYMPEYTQGELAQLNELQAFKKIMNDYFEKRAQERLVAIVFLSGPFESSTFYGKHTGHEALVYKNPLLEGDAIYSFPFVDLGS